MRIPLLFQAGGVLFAALCLMGARDPLPGEILLSEGISYRAEGKELQEAGELQRAATAFQRAVSVRPDYAEAYNDLGVVLESMGNLPQAQEAYENAIRLNPALRAAHTNLALLHEEAGHIQEASEHWVARIRLGPSDDPWVLRSRAKMKQYNLPVPEAQADLVQKRRDEVKLAIEGGKAHTAAGRHEEAVKEFARARALDPGNAQAARLMTAAESKAKAEKLQQMKAEAAALAKMKKASKSARKLDAKEKATRRAGAKDGAEQAQLIREMEAAKKKAKAAVAAKAPAGAQPPVVAQPPTDAMAIAQEYARERAKTRKSAAGELYQRGATAMRQGEYQEAVDAYRQILVLDPGRRDAQLALERAEKAMAASGKEADRY